MSEQSNIIDQLDGHWQKILIFVLWKLAPDGVNISHAEMDACQKQFEAEGGIALFTHGHETSIDLQTVSLKHAQELEMLAKSTGAQA